MRHLAVRCSRIAVLGALLGLSRVNAAGVHAPGIMPVGKAGDAAAKQKLLGYWKSPRHDYLISSDGIMYMCPRKDATTKEPWDVRGNRFYQGADAYEIVTLTESKFVYREQGGSRTAFTLVRTTKKEAEGE